MIIAGSMPVVEEEELYNVSYICKRDGTIESQYNFIQHLTKRDWIMKAETALRHLIPTSAKSASAMTWSFQSLRVFLPIR